MAFGTNQIKNETPKWATWTFRVVLYVSSITTIYVQMDDALPAGVAKRITLFASLATIAVHMASKMFGVPLPANEQTETKQ